MSNASVSCPYCHKEFEHDVIVDTSNWQPDDFSNIQYMIENDGFAYVEAMHTCPKCGKEFEQDVDINTLPEATEKSK